MKDENGELDEEQVRDLLYCPGYSGEEVHDRVSSAWDFVGPVPVPSFDVSCHQCDEGEDSIKLRFVSYGVRDKGGVTYRCDVAFKCITCFALFTCGVPITEDCAKRAKKLFGRDKPISEQDSMIINAEQIQDNVLSNPDFVQT